MSRTKSKQNVEICGDCGATDATWVSVNKGILLCTQCCSIHRSLGRHISQVKSLLKSSWNQNQLNMVMTLNNNGANNIWEHLLLENGAKLLKKKPTAKDPVSVKQEYIKAKHQQCLYAFRENYEDGLLSVENELGKQLHASVRTPNLETSFRLLALGADPNYFHDEKGSTPLHVAIKSDQKLQVELLLVYGADPTCPDSQRRTPLDYSRQLNNKELMNRLIESQYEVTDLFSYYLSLRKPEHSTGVHFLIPSTGFKSNPASLAKLQKLPNHVFEELVMDVYDEVDRRQTESIWLSCADTTELSDVPFLPVDNTLSTTRNQGRQKLARFTTPELKSLVYEILVDTQRRQSADKGSMIQLRQTSEIDDDPLYDSVAEDEDYAVPMSKEEEMNKKDSIISIDNINKTNQVLEALTKQLRNSDNTITDLRTEVTKLRQCLKALQNENSELKVRLSQKVSFANGDSGFDSLEYIGENQTLDSSIISNGKGTDVVELRSNRKSQRPNSMFETREAIGKVPNWHAIKAQFKQGDNIRNTSPGLYSMSPDREIVLQCTEQVTRTIQQMYKSIQVPENEDCVVHGEKVKAAIVKLATTLSKDPESEKIKLMLEVASRLLPECQKLQNSKLNADTKAVDLHFVNIRDIAFNLAKLTKEIVTKYSTNQ
ncbi:ARF GTPase-activating protein GIT2 [Sitophilus oryzae]|uniref:ARF GTPase-activating protein GIT2 n=1 Tax=Sitophilus oryzae TaxID=7048 RepID=A0A6J2YLW2_SITOR|nr:ARF GTPase-activating protein GIT2 [Sitophilus oryzae]